MPKSVFFAPSGGWEDSDKTVSIRTYGTAKLFHPSPDRRAMEKEKRGAQRAQRKCQKHPSPLFFYFADVPLDLPKLQYVAPKVQRQKR